ncbi:MAG: hypothetical protein ACYDAR_04075 [Thermomicrobiales bacterium]
MDRLVAGWRLFILAMLVGSLVLLIAPAAGVPDFIIFPGAAMVTLGVFALCIRASTPWSRPIGRRGPRNLGIRLYSVGPSPTLEEIAEQLDEGARKRRHGRRIRARQRSHGTHRHHS